MGRRWKLFCWRFLGSLVGLGYTSFVYNAVIKLFILKNRGKMKEGDFYLAGGSGYTISRKALAAYVEGPLRHCDTKEEGSAEDVHFSRCFKKAQNKFFYTGGSDGSQRYHQGPVYDPIRYRIFRSSLEHINRLPRNITNLKEGVLQKIDKRGTISNSSIAFHKHYSPTELRRLHILLYDNLTLFCSSCT